MSQTLNNRRFWLMAIVAVTALSLGAAFLFKPKLAPTMIKSGEMPRNEAIEQRWGIRVTQIAVTADNGLVDFRYLVLDPDKALTVFDEVKNRPQLIAETSGTVVTATVPMVHRHDLRAGSVYFELFYNPQGQVRPGQPFAVKIGDLQLDHVVVR